MKRLYYFFSMLCRHKKQVKAMIICLPDKIIFMCDTCSQLLVLLKQLFPVYPVEDIIRYL